MMGTMVTDDDDDGEMTEMMMMMMIAKRFENMFKKFHKKLSLQAAPKQPFCFKRAGDALDF